MKFSDVDYTRICSFNDKLSDHKIKFYKELFNYNRVVGSYDKQPFCIEYNDECVVLGYKTKIKDYIDYFIEAISKMLNKAPFCTYVIVNAEMNCVEWTYNECDRYEKLTSSSNIEKLEMYKR